MRVYIKKVVYEIFEKMEQIMKMTGQKDKNLVTCATTMWCFLLQKLNTRMGSDSLGFRHSQLCHTISHFWIFIGFLKRIIFYLFLLPTLTYHLHAGSRIMAERWQEYFTDFTAEWQDTEGWEKFSDWRQPEEALGYRRMAEERGFHVVHSEVFVNIDFCIFVTTHHLLFPV